MIWVAVGGRGTLIGGALGAVLVNYAKTTFTTGLLAPYWLFALGAMFVLVTIFLPKGMLGLLPRRERAASPPPLWGGQGGGIQNCVGVPPTPNPSPQGGGESRAAGAAQPAE